MTRVNRTMLSQAVAKAVAYHECGQRAKAEEWARLVVELLECHGILKPAP